MKTVIRFKHISNLVINYLYFVKKTFKIFNNFLLFTLKDIYAFIIVKLKIHENIYKCYGAKHHLYSHF